MSSNLEIWQKVEVTPPDHTKGFAGRAGGFKGTAMNATWLAQRATELFGPCGIGWGMTVLDDRYVSGAPLLDKDGAVIGHELVHVVHAKLWYIHEGKRGEIEQYGQTQMVGKNKNGLFTDEEAPKKSMTDAMSKCLSMLGFGADIFKGYYDDNKYVNDLRREFREEEPQREAPRQEPAQRPTRAVDRLPPAKHMQAIKNAANKEELKQVFALAWKQYENPADPAAKTDAQLKFKDAYDKRTVELLAAESDFNVE